jgi:aspartyl-tRNA(Asn)/glutamyl-tRNA(Gln) amidotransferase subunit A
MLDGANQAVLFVSAPYRRFTAPVNLAGLPALVFPVGRTTNGLPIGAQLIGHPWSEELLLLGFAYEPREH